MTAPRILSPLAPRRRRLPSDPFSAPRAGRSSIRYRSMLSRLVAN